jgi:hypothetical protein
MEDGPDGAARLSSGRAIALDFRPKASAVALVSLVGEACAGYPLTDYLPIRRPQDLAILSDGLRKAGLPE